jgi:hypothetical protein
MSWELPLMVDKERSVSRIKFNPNGGFILMNPFWENGLFDWSNELQGHFALYSDKSGIAIKLTSERPKLKKTEFLARLKQIKTKGWDWQPYQLYIEGITDEKDYLGVPFIPFRMSP